MDPTPAWKPNPTPGAADPAAAAPATAIPAPAGARATPPPATRAAAGAPGAAPGTIPRDFPPLPAPPSPAPKPAVSGKILRFRKTERMLHWALAIPFLVCYGTAVILAIVYSPDPQRPFRDVFAWTHRISGVLLILLPALAVPRRAGDWKVHLDNVKQAWIWTFDDIRWLFLMGLAAVNDKITLPDQGKFNAAEKLNFMLLMTTYPLYILTGLIIWTTETAFLAWLVHVGMAVVATPLVLGHIFMATVNPATRVGLSGMITGFVDRQWAKHHYARWYRENFGRGAGGSAGNGSPVPRGSAPGRAATGKGPPPQLIGERKSAIVLEVLTGRRTEAEACRRYGIARSTLEKWVDRFVEAGRKSLGG